MECRSRSVVGGAASVRSRADRSGAVSSAPALGPTVGWLSSAVLSGSDPPPGVEDLAGLRSVLGSRSAPGTAVSPAARPSASATSLVEEAASFDDSARQAHVTAKPATTSPRRAAARTIQTGTRLPEWLAAPFAQEPAVIDYAAACLRICSLGYGFYAVGMIVTQAFNGAGDTDTPTFINLFCLWLVQLPLAWWLSQSVGWGPAGVFAAIAISDSLVAFVAVAIFRRGRWKLRTV